MADAAEHLAAQQQVMMTQLADLRVDVRALADLRGDVRALTARVDTQLAHGSRKMDDLEGRVRVIEQALPDNLDARIGAVEAAAQRRSGAVSVVTLIISLAVGIGGSSTAAAIVTYLLTRH